MPLTRQRGFTLIELLVAMAISGIVLGAIASLLLVLGDFRKRYAHTLEMENLRNIVRGRVACGRKCTEVKASLPAAIGGMPLTVDCDEWFEGVKITTVVAGKIEPLFQVGGGDLCAPRTGSCVESCHNRGLLLDRGFLTPPVEGVEHGMAQRLLVDGGFTCPDETVPIGVDFALGRMICDAPGGGAADSTCAEMHTFTQGHEATHAVAMRGSAPCTEFTQLKVVDARLGGALAVTLADGYQPSAHDAFVIIRAVRSVTGRFAQHENRAWDRRGGSFKIVYEPNAVILTDYRPPSP